MFTFVSDDNATNLYHHFIINIIIVIIVIFEKMLKIGAVFPMLYCTLFPHLFIFLSFPLFISRSHEIAIFSRESEHSLVQMEGYVAIWC